jgi:hypothetical protein
MKEQRSASLQVLYRKNDTMLSGPQVLCRSFFTPGRDIGSVGFVAVEDIVLWFHSELPYVS